MPVCRRRLRPGELGVRRLELRRPHVGPDEAAQLDRGIRRLADLVLEGELLRLVHHVHATAADVELPAVIDAPQPTLLVAAEEQRGASMRAWCAPPASRGWGPAGGGATVDYDQAMTRSSGIPVSLARLRTRDGVWLDGLIAEPRRGRRTALIWVHGLGSMFSSAQPLIRELSTRLNAAGIGYFKFNNRGHDVVAGRGRHLAGAAFERFGQSVEDIRAMVAFARKRGYRRVILAGHSPGANKVPPHRAPGR